MHLYLPILNSSEAVTAMFENESVGQAQLVPAEHMRPLQDLETDSQLANQVYGVWGRNLDQVCDTVVKWSTQ